MTMYYGIIAALQDLVLSKRRGHTIWDKVPYGYDTLNCVSSERCEMGLDMVKLQTFLPEVPAALWDKMKWRSLNAQSRRVPGHIGRFNLGGIELRLFRFPSAASSFCGENRLLEPLTPRDFDLTIRFNPTTLHLGHNMWGDDGHAILCALVKVRERLEGLGLMLDLLRLPLTEIHLTRDLIWYGSLDSRLLSQSECEQVGMDLSLRLMEWGKPPYAREFENYMNDSRRALSSIGRPRSIGLVRGSKFSKWVAYDKVQQHEDKGKPLPSMRGRLLRVEWRLRRAFKIEKYLKIRDLHDWIVKIDYESDELSKHIRSYLENSKQSEFEHLIPAMNIYCASEQEHSLYQNFDVAFAQTFFFSEKAYTKRMPTLPSIFVKAVAQYFVSDIQRKCLERLKMGNPITRPDADILIVVLNGIGSAHTRSLLRFVFGMDVAEGERLDESEKRRRRKQHDACVRILFRLRAGARYNALHTWSDLHQRMLVKWEAHRYVEAELLDSLRDDSDVLSGQEFRELVSPLLEQLISDPYITDGHFWTGHCSLRRTTINDVEHFMPEDLLRVYRRMSGIEQATVENPKIRYVDEQKTAIWRARELEILPLFPETKKRAARIKVPKSPGT